MPNYAAGQAIQLGVGETVDVSTATLTTPFSTQAVVIGRDGAQPCELVVYNRSAVVATVQVSDNDVDADYLALKVDGTAVTVTATTAGEFRCIAKFLRLSYASDPGATRNSIQR